MSDDKLDLKLNVDVEVNDAERLAAVRKELELINREIRRNASIASGGAAVAGVKDHLAELKKTWTFQRRMRAQEKAESNEAARAAQDEARAVEQRYKEQMAFNSRMAAQRLREERATESAIQREVRETARMRDRAATQARNDLRALQREQEQAARQVGRGAGKVRSGVGRAVTAGGATAAATAYAANRVVGDLTRSGVTLDKALNQNTKLSGLSPKDAEAAGQALVRKAAPIARQLGIKTAEFLAARAEAIQAGVSDELVDTVTEFGSKFARLNDMNPSEVMESSGYGITALGAFGKVTAERVKSLFNVQQHLAATTAASRQVLARSCAEVLARELPPGSTWRTPSLTAPPRHPPVQTERAPRGCSPARRSALLRCRRGPPGSPVSITRARRISSSWRCRASSDSEAGPT